MQTIEFVYLITKKSMTPFNTYLHRLQSDDSALSSFLADPIGESEANGLTKAERSVLRRVLVSASNNSTNGYAIVRPLQAYRQGVRMLQNAMHRNMGAAAAVVASGSVGGAMTASPSDNTSTLLIYYGSDPANPKEQPYANGVHFTGTGSTIGELLDSVVANNKDKLSYENSTIKYSDPGPFIGSFTINGNTYNAPPPPTGDQAGIAFWFYSINGRPGPHTLGKKPRASYYDQTIDSHSVIFWQVIAPGTEYGFQACGPAPKLSLAS